MKEKYEKCPIKTMGNDHGDDDDDAKWKEEEEEVKKSKGRREAGLSADEYNESDYWRIL